jgi:hypothetical protein
MELEVSNNSEQQEATNQAGRPPPIILISATNLLQLQKQLRGIVKGSFEFLNAKTGTRVVTKDMADFLSHQNLLHFTKTVLLFLFREVPKTFKSCYKAPPFCYTCRRDFEALVERLRCHQRQADDHSSVSFRRS